MKYLEELTSIFAKGDKFSRHKFVSPVFETIKNGATSKVCVEVLWLNMTLIG